MINYKRDVYKKLDFLFEIWIMVVMRMLVKIDIKIEEENL